jgi:hypothetical protein
MNCLESAQNRFSTGSALNLRSSRTGFLAIARDDLLFTMSDNTHSPLDEQTGAKLMFLSDELKAFQIWRPPLVEPDGIEPTTSCLQSRRSPN